MNFRMGRGRGARGFTLIELLVVLGIIAILTAIILPFFGRTKLQADVVKTLSNMRQMGAAMIAYANDNNYQLPNRAVPVGNAPQPDKWPVLLQQYVQSTAVYTSPIPDVNGKSYKVTSQAALLSNSANGTSYIYNGMNDLGALNDASVTVRINNISQPSMTILLGIPYPQMGQYYMDFSEGAGNNNDVLNKTAFPAGSVYMFCDGSSRVLTKTTDAAANLQRPINGGTYTDWLWLINKDATNVIQQGH